LPKFQWWLKLRPLNRILAKHETVYLSEHVRDELEDVDDIDNRHEELEGIKSGILPELPDLRKIRSNYNLIHMDNNESRKNENISEENEDSEKWNEDNLVKPVHDEPVDQLKVPDLKIGQ
jgi:hypothetical protein